MDQAQLSWISNFIWGIAAHEVEGKEVEA